MIGRLLKRADFLRVQAGRSAARRSFVLKGRPRQSACGRPASEARFGFAVTKRLGSAVVRNRARRRLKEAVRLVAPEHAKPGYDYVVIGRPGAVDAAFAEILEELRTALRSIHLERGAALRRA